MRPTWPLTRGSVVARSIATPQLLGSVPPTASHAEPFPIRKRLVGLDSQHRRRERAVPGATRCQPKRAMPIASGTARCGIYMTRRPAPCRRGRRACACACGQRCHSAQAGTAPQLEAASRCVLCCLSLCERRGTVLHLVVPQTSRGSLAHVSGFGLRTSCMFDQSQVGCQQHQQGHAPSVVS